MYRKETLMQIKDFTITENMAIAMKKEYFPIMEKNNRAISEEMKLRAIAEPIKQQAFNRTINGIDAKSISNELSIIDGNIAVINISGPIFRNFNFYVYFFGGSVIEDLMAALELALSDNYIKAIVLNIDSPGGEVNGTSEFSDMIFKSRGIKPIIAYVGGSADSAAYWIGSSADKMVIEKTADVGSIGVYATFYDYSEQDKLNGIKEIKIISAQSPKKVPDPATPDGQRQIQETINQLGKIFIESVARNRNVSTEIVSSEFGQGDIVIGENAVSLKMADEIGDFKSVIESISGGSMEKNLQTGQPNAEPVKITKELILSSHSEIANEFIAEGQAKERERISALNELSEKGFEDIIAKAISDGSDVATTAINIAKARKDPARIALQARAVDAGNIPNTGSGEPETGDDKRVIESMKKFAKAVA